MKKYLLLSSLFIAVGICITITPILAQDDIFAVDSEFSDPAALLDIDTSPLASPAPDLFYTGRVLEIISEQTEDNLGIAQASVWTQVVTIEVLDGPSEGEKIEMKYGGLAADKKLQKGEKLVLLAPNGIVDPGQFYIFERYRLGTRPSAS